MTQTPSTALRSLESWPVKNVSAALIDGEHEWTFGDCDREYELASVTKLLTAYAFLVALEEGVYELDTACEALPGASVEHLLAHASGVGFMDRSPEREVGERRIYSSAGFEILADLLEERSGISFQDYFREAVCKPLGLEHTELRGSPGHGAYSTVNDLVVFGRELMHPTMLHQSTLDNAFSVHFPELVGLVPGYGMFKPCPWGLGFEIKGEKQPHWTAPDMPAETVGHFGQAGTFLWLVPGMERAMVCLTDRPFGKWAKPLWEDTNEAIWQALG